MTAAPAFIIPGSEGIAAAYAEMRAHQVSPLVACDWLLDQVHAATRDDVADQLARNNGAPAQKATEPGAAVTNEIRRIVRMAVAVYNQQRPHISLVDHIATPQGAAAINRAAVARQIRTNDTQRAMLQEPLDLDTVQVNRAQAHHYVAGVIQIENRARAISARLTSKRGKNVRLTHFDVLMP